MNQQDSIHAIAVKSSGSREELPSEILTSEIIASGIMKTEEGHSFRISKEMDYSDVSAIELTGFEEIAEVTEEGYIVLPRAKGFDDYGLCLFNQHKEDFDITVSELNMPIFGVKTKDHCFLAVVSGMTWNFSIRIVLNNGKYSIYPTFDVDGEQPYEDFCIEFFKLCGKDDDYSGMARRYRTYRMEKKELTPLSQRAKENPYVDYAMNSVMIRVRCGWKPAPAQILHQTPENEPPMHVACDFDRVGDILDELKAQGVDKAEICLVGWNVKGHDGRWPQAFPVCKELGGEEKLRVLIQKAQSMGYQITCHTNSTDQYEIADCYDEDNTRRNKAGEPVKNAAWSGGQMYDLCPQIGYEQAKEILPQVADLGFRGIHYIDVLGVVYPRKCYHEKHFVTYPQAVEYAGKLCEFTREQFGGMSSEGAYDFLAPYLDFGLYISFNQAGKGICDRSIPFWQIVYHGTVLSNPYTCTVNSTFKEPENFLKMIEYGGRPTYYYYSAFMNNGNNWMGSTDCICDTDEQLKDSVARIKKGYEEYRKLAELHTAYMEKHEEVGEGVFEVTYSDGSVIRVDYNEKCYEIIDK